MITRLSNMFAIQSTPRPAGTLAVISLPPRDLDLLVSGGTADIVNYTALGTEGSVAEVSTSC